MLRRIALGWSLIAALLIAAAAPKPGTGPLPPGAQHVLTIEGENTVTFVPQAGLDPFKIDYLARVEYIVNTRRGEEAVAKKKAGGKTTVAAPKGRRKEAGTPASKVTGAVDLSIHSSEVRFRRNGQPVVESRMSRSRFQGRLQPDAPVINVASNEAPPYLYAMLKTFDTTIASILLDDDSKAVKRNIRPDGPFHALTETLLSIHTPIPRGVAYWEAPTQLAMGQGQTAKGTLRFEKDKESVAKTGGFVKVKVSGVLKAEGVVVGNFIKDGSYTVTGEQMYDPSTREWKTSRWSVLVDNELANQGGQTVARAKGNMVVESKMVDEARSAVESPKAKTKAKS